VIEVLEREERELPPSDYLQSQRLAYNDWLQKAREAANVQDFWTAQKVPRESQLSLPTPTLPPPAQ
jgi:hypothetical protein